MARRKVMIGNGRNRHAVYMGSKKRPITLYSQSIIDNVRKKNYKLVG